MVIQVTEKFQAIFYIKNEYLKPYV
jgi:hypothetical protein